MKQGTVKFSKEFKTLTGNVWLGIENEYDMNTEDPIDVFKRAEETIQQYAYASGLVFHIDYSALPKDIPFPQPPSVINVERTSEDIRIAELIRNIYACTELEGDNGLLSYNKLALTNREALHAFDIMFRKLAPQK